MKNKITILFTILYLSISIIIAQTPLKVISTTITFKIKNAGLNVTGSFKGFEGEIKFDPELLKTSFIKASVDANTINTGITSRDNHLRKEEYFDVVKYPKISIASSFFGKDGNNFRGYFKLNMKGVTKDIVIPFTFENTTMKGEFTFDRRDFKIGGNSLILGDNVTVSIQINLSKAN
jgi:polyisoprenoid-binding protein YceI